jgi:hypothetical protein
MAALGQAIVENDRIVQNRITAEFSFTLEREG